MLGNPKSRSQDPRARRGGDSRRGIALVVVLGMLSVLVLLAVAFSVTMRVERLATRNYLDVVKARQLMGAALARAMDAVDQDIGDEFYPFWEAMGSTNGSVVAPNPCEGTATNYLPASLRAAAADVGGRLRWQDIRSGTNLVGRYAFLAVDCSGFLDASVVGGEARAKGQTGAEIVLSDLPEVIPGRVANFVSQRQSEWKRFETLPELWELCRGTPFSQFPANFFVYSRFSEDMRPVSTGYAERIRLDLNANELFASRHEIVQAFGLCGIPRADLVFSNLLDYVDTDHVPGDVNSFLTEAVPMINEIVVSNRVTMLDPSNMVFRHDVSILVETWHPFPGPSPSVTVVAPDPADISFPMCQPPGISPSLDPDGPTVPGPGGQGAYSFRTNAFTYSVTATNVVFPGGNMGLRTQINRLEVRLENDTPVDRVNGPITLDNLIVGQNIQSLPPGGSVSSVIGVSCRDPRMNWLAEHWEKEVVTLGTTNRNAYCGEGPGPMYVRNNVLQSVAELGFLSVGEPWRTIALYSTNGGPGLHPVLDYFKIGTTFVYAARGKVNPNSSRPYVLAAVFDGCPVERYPGGSVVTTVSWAAACALATNVLAANASVMTNIATFGSNLFDNVLPFWNTSDAERESVIRNSYELFGLRQQLFTIFLAVQAVQDANGQPGIQEEDVRAEQRAVAVVWRDALPDPAALDRHPTMIRFFRWLTE